MTSREICATVWHQIMSTATTAKSRSGFDRALETIERLALDEQEALVDVVHRRIAASRKRVARCWCGTSQRRGVITGRARFAVVRPRT